METIHTSHLKLMKGRFKSYYVVWKPGYAVFRYFEKREFKSYYVVWKLFCSTDETKKQI